MPVKSKAEEAFEAWSGPYLTPFDDKRRADFCAGFAAGVNAAAGELRAAWDARSRIDLEGYPQALDDAMCRIRRLSEDPS